MSTTYYVRQHGEGEATEHPTDGDATAHAGAMSLLHGGVWLVIRKTGRLSTVVRRLKDHDPYPKASAASRTENVDTP